jgi:hypothetical protein
VYKSYFLSVVFFLTVFIPAYPQESLKSVEEEYYDFLALQGSIERPYLNYRTLSDSAWAVSEGSSHLWAYHNLGTMRYFFDDRLKLRIYGPELFMSVNTAAPYGQNDGALWQGRGFNTSFTGGVRLAGYGVEAVFKPQLSFSQNAAFDIMPSNYDSEYGYFWGYGHNIGIDAPQRFGNKPFFTWDWGDSEIRYTWRTLTAGFGTQAVWLGPAYLNPMLHSNNAPTYPKFDIGLRRQPVTIPWIGWHIGDIEARIWIGYLSESDYFDNNDKNDHTMFHGFAFSYAPSFLPGLTLSANRVCMVPWEWSNLKYMFPGSSNTYEDQKASFSASYLLPKAGIDIYGELGIDDFVPGGFVGYLRYPFHTMSYTVGLKKTVKVIPKHLVYGELIFEWNKSEMSQDFQFQWPYSFYFHHNITHGYTNKGQLVGAGSGWAGNSQFLMFRFFYPKGETSIFVHRSNPDNNFIYSQTIYTKVDSGRETERKYFTAFRSDLTVGLNTRYFLLKNLSLGGGMAYMLIINPYYFYSDSAGKTFKEFRDIYQHNFSFNVAVKYSL